MVELLEYSLCRSTLRYLLGHELTYFCVLGSIVDCEFNHKALFDNDWSQVLMIMLLVEMLVANDN